MRIILSWRKILTRYKDMCLYTQRNPICVMTK